MQAAKMDIHERVAINIYIKYPYSLPTHGGLPYLLCTKEEAVPPLEQLGLAEVVSVAAVEDGVGRAEHQAGPAKHRLYCPK